MFFLDKNIDSAAEMVSNIISLGMRMYIPNKNKSIKPKDRSWFNKTCAAAVKSKEEWKSNPTPENELLRKEVRYRCNAILKQQQSLHEQKLRRKVLDYRKGSKNFWSFVCAYCVHTAFDQRSPDLHALGWKGQYSGWNRFAICSSFHLKQVNFLHVGKLQTFNQFLKRRSLGPRKLSTHSHLL